LLFFFPSLPVFSHFIQGTGDCEQTFDRARPTRDSAHPQNSNTARDISADQMKL
jgi:hypothetical protein